jgi:hypothetical protein
MSSAIGRDAFETCNWDIARDLYKMNIHGEIDRSLFIDRQLQPFAGFSGAGMKERSLTEGSEPPGTGTCPK